MGFYQQVAEAERKGIPFVLATVIEAGGSTPRSAGARMLIREKHTVGTIGGGALEFRVIQTPTTPVGPIAINSTRVSTPPRFGQQSGGKMSVFLEKVYPN